MTSLERVCVFCGSSDGARAEYLEAARRVGCTLAGSGIGVVYGGASVGLMGAVADAALEAGGEVIGVIPGALFESEVAHRGLTELHTVESLHARKALMTELSDAFLTLPGGHGTHDELFEALTWLQLGIHGKPVGLVNVGGYYDGLLAHLDRVTREGFIRPRHREMLLADSSIDGLLVKLESW